MMDTFKPVLTQDSSPTLLHLPSGELMHNKAGAVSETFFIYNRVIQYVFDQNWSLRFLSVGLGVGYNELTVAATLLQKKKFFKLTSMESDIELSSNFTAWLYGKTDSFYDAILLKVSKQIGNEPERIKSFLRASWQSGDFTIGGQLDRDTRFNNKFEGIFYDPFSRNVNPELWSESFLRDFLQRACAPNCVFATYASHSSLKNALKSSGFELEKNLSFGGKREYTFAIREEL